MKPGIILGPSRCTRESPFLTQCISNFQALRALLSSLLQPAESLREHNVCRKICSPHQQGAHEQEQNNTSITLQLRHIHGFHLLMLFHRPKHVVSTNGKSPVKRRLLTWGNDTICKASSFFTSYRHIHVDSHLPNNVKRAHVFANPEHFLRIHPNVKINFASAKLAGSPQNKLLQQQIYTHHKFQLPADTNSPPPCPTQSVLLR